MMPVIRVKKTKNYTVMSNFHLRDKRLSAKAIGVMSIMLSLPDDWDFTIGGLMQIIKDGRDSIAGALHELERYGYLHREQERVKSGVFGGFVYTLYEEPQTGFPKAVKPKTGFPKAVKPKTAEPKPVNPSLLNTDIRSTDLLSTDKTNTEYTTTTTTTTRACEGGDSDTDQGLSRAVKLYADNINPAYGPIESEKLLMLYDRYHSKWLEAAIIEAAESSRRPSVKYIEAILERWERDGFKSKRRKDGNHGDNPGGHRKPTEETETDRLLREKEQRDAAQIERWAREGGFSA